MKSIYSTFTGLFKDGKPIDFLATWKKTLEMMASGDSFRQYLDVQGCFDRYSVANAILAIACRY